MNRKRLKIIVTGNSVAMRVRPPEQFPSNSNYTVLLQDLLDKELNRYCIQVDNKAKGALLSRVILSDIDSLIQEFPNYYIINIGVVDSSTREVPHWFYRYINKQVKTTFEYIVSGLYARIFMKHRPFFVKLRGKKSWISAKLFENYFNNIISTLLKETNARIITLSINPANDRVEQQLPGSQKNHFLYNDIIKSITLKYKQLFIDTTAFIKQQDYPDGVHYSASGHRVIAEKLKELIINDFKNQFDKLQEY